MQGYYYYYYVLLFQDDYIITGIISFMIGAIYSSYPHYPPTIQPLITVFLAFRKWCICNLINLLIVSHYHMIIAEKKNRYLHEVVSRKVKTKMSMLVCSPSIIMSNLSAFRYGGRGSHTSHLCLCVMYVLMEMLDCPVA